jgi:hypothetical protein
MGGMDDTPEHEGVGKSDAPARLLCHAAVGGFTHPKGLLRNGEVAIAAKGKGTIRPAFPWASRGACKRA